MTEAHISQFFGILTLINNYLKPQGIYEINPCPFLWVHILRRGLNLEQQ